MDLTKCKNDHFYDSDKFLSCPHCANQMAGVTIHDIMGTEQNQIDTAMPTPKQLLHTVPNGKTVGWLVCISGAMRGESFVLREGDNYIGRAANMDIALLYEPTVSREKHAVISFDSEKNACILYSPEHQKQTFCNNKEVKTKRTLKNRDMVSFGECSFFFISLCGSSFRWTDN